MNYDHLGIGIPGLSLEQQREIVLAVESRRPQRADPPGNQFQCIYRNGPPQLLECKPCQSSGRTPLLFVCGLHGVCTVFSSGWRDKSGSRPAACCICPDRVAADIATVATDSLPV